MRQGHRGYTLPNSTALSLTKAGRFPIVESVGPLGYRLELPYQFEDIYPVISVIHLEQYRPGLFNRQVPYPHPEIIDGVERHSGGYNTITEDNDGTVWMKVR